MLVVGKAMEGGENERTIVHTPLRSCIVLSGGAAILTCAFII